jgi:inorganic pyrophosphatase/exopolyphosphatase
MGWPGAAARSDAINRETAYLLERFQLEAPPPSTDARFADSDWCLLDHNQKARRRYGAHDRGGASDVWSRGCTRTQDKVAEGVNLHRLVCVIDHHQLQANAVEVVEPRSVEIQPWGMGV